MERKQEKVAMNSRTCEHKALNNKGRHWNYTDHKWDCDKCYKSGELSNYLPKNPREFQNIKSAFERVKNTA